jgi:hypothetical protein
MLTLTISTMKAHGVDHPEDIRQNFFKFHGRYPDENTPYTDWMACSPSIGDWMWDLRCFGSVGLRIGVRVAIGAVRRVLHLFEARLPHEARPRKALEAAERWLQEPTFENRVACRNAAVAYSRASRAPDFPYDTQDDSVKAACSACLAALYVAEAIAAEDFADVLDKACNAARSAAYNAGWKTGSAFAASAANRAEEDAQKADFRAALALEEAAHGNTKERR